MRSVSFRRVDFVAELTLSASSRAAGQKERRGEPDVHGCGDRAGWRRRPAPLAANAASTAEVAADLRARQPPFVATIARGSSDHAALYLKHLVELKVALACASLAPSMASLYHAPLRLKGAVVIAISQSGRSPDIVAMQRTAKDHGAATVAFVNDAASPLARGADALLCLHAGPERSVAATKSMDRFAGRRRLACGPLERRPRSSGRARQASSVLDLSSAAPLAASAIETLAQASSLFVVGAAPRTPSPRRRR